MTFKETIFFVGQCLTINYEEKNKLVIKNILNSQSVDWDSVIKVSTSHLVLPALYLNLQSADFLKYLPKDLVEYMNEITKLNRKRNLQIIEQAKEINGLLISNGIKPIFLKGTGNLLEGLYEDIGERMVGDIDFIVKKSELIKTIIILKKNHYENLRSDNNPFPYYRHIERIIKDNRIAAVEIHKELLNKNYTKEFNYDLIKKEAQNFGDIFVMSYEHQIILSSIAKQINDDGIFYKDIALRSAYDIYLLSRKRPVFELCFGLDKLHYPFICFIAICSEVFNHPDSLKYTKSKSTEKYLNTFLELLNNKKQRNIFRKKIFIKIYISKRLNIIYNCFLDGKYRIWVLKCLTNKEWYRKKLIRLGVISLKE